MTCVPVTKENVDTFTYEDKMNIYSSCTVSPLVTYGPAGVGHLLLPKLAQSFLTSPPLFMLFLLPGIPSPPISVW